VPVPPACGFRRRASRDTKKQKGWGKRPVGEKPAGGGRPRNGCVEHPCPSRRPPRRASEGDRAGHPRRSSRMAVELRASALRCGTRRAPRPRNAGEGDSLLRRASSSGRCQVNSLIALPLSYGAMMRRLAAWWPRWDSNPCMPDIGRAAGTSKRTRYETRDGRRPEKPLRKTKGPPYDAPVPLEGASRESNPRCRRRDLHPQRAGFESAASAGWATSADFSA
jgi:hypothetical protein